jgi:F0F1-type ATP synthase membrane subunit b/b'
VATVSGDRDALEQLGADEARLERALAEARASADARLAAARREAELLGEVARQEAEREADRIRASAAEEVDRLQGAAEAELRAVADELRRRAARNRTRAVARAVSAVLATGGEAP